MPITIHEKGDRNEVSIPASVRVDQDGTIVLDGEGNRVVIGEGTTVQGARIHLGSHCSFECGPDCRLGGIDVRAERDSHVRIGAGTDLTTVSPIGMPEAGRITTAQPPVAASPEHVRATESRREVSPQEFATAVHPADEALQHHLEYFGDVAIAESAYLRQGEWAVDAVRQIAETWFGGMHRVSRMLEFSPAYGCVTRHLARELPPERLWCADTDPDSVRFVHDTFGIRGFVAPANPAAIRCEEPFDLIFAPTVFGTLPEERFEPLLERLLELLAPRGVLAFGVRDELWYAPRQTPAEGFAFVPVNTPGRPGVTFVTEHFVRCCIERICGLDWPYQRLPRGLCSHFDLYVVGNDEAMQKAVQPVRGGPEGCLEQCRATDLGIELAGWAGDPDRGHLPPTVEVLLDGHVVARAHPGVSRPDVAAVLKEPRYATAGWMTAIQPPADAAGFEGSFLQVRAVADDGRVRQLAAAPVATLVGRRLC